MNLRVDEVHAIHLVGDDAHLIEAAILDWMHSPYWSLGPSGSKWFEPRHGNDSGSESSHPACVESGTAIEENAMALHIRHMCHRQRAVDQDLARDSEAPALPLVDRYLSRPGGALSHDALSAIDEACTSQTSTTAVITLTDGRLARASIPTVLALITCDALMSCVRYPMEHGITRIIGTHHLHSMHRRSFRRTSYRHRKVLLEPGAPFVDITHVLPTSSGRQARLELVASPLAGVPVALYPLMATVVPEVSGYLVPTINVESITGQIDPLGHVVVTRRAKAQLWRFSRRSSARGVLLNIYVAVLARLRSSGKKLIVSRSLLWLGIDRSQLLATLTRFLTRSSGNPWLTGRSLRDYEFTILEVEGSLIAS